MKKEEQDEPIYVIRCSQCKNWDKSWRSLYGEKGHYCWLLQRFVSKDDYCSFARKVENDEV